MKNLIWISLILKVLLSMISIAHEIFYLIIVKSNALIKSLPTEKSDLNNYPMKPSLPFGNLCQVFESIENTTKRYLLTHIFIPI